MTHQRLKPVPKTGVTEANARRAIKQKALRESLASRGLVQHVLDISSKLSDPDNNIDPAMVTRYRAAAEIQAKLINKYLPDLKSVEMVGDPENPLEHSISISFVKPDANRDS